MLKEVRIDDIPAGRGAGRRRSVLGDDIDEFAKSGMQAAELTRSGWSNQQVYRNARSYLKTHKYDNIACKSRGGKIYLTRI